MKNKFLTDDNKKELFCDWIKKFPTELALINILLIGLMLLFATVYAAEDNWVYIGEKEDILWFVNAESITCKENICRAWVKMQPLIENEYTVGLNEYNCMEMKYKILRATKYDSNGNTIRRVSPMEEGWKYIVPESTSKELCNFVCKTTSNHREQQKMDEKDAKKGAEENPIREGEAKKIVESAKQVQSKGFVPPEKVETQSKTAEDKKEKSLQSQKPSETIFTVQAGAFRNASYAEALTTWLKEKGYHAYITFLGSKKGEKLYKVCIGKFIEKEKAKTLSEKIKNSEGLQTFVTPLQP
jgi:cell division septation protein DedD